MKRILIYSVDKDILLTIKKKLRKIDDGDLVLIGENEFTKAVETKDKRWLNLLLDIEQSLVGNNKAVGEQMIVIVREMGHKVTPTEKRAFEYYREITGGDTRLMVVQFTGNGNIVNLLLKVLTGNTDEIYFSGEITDEIISQRTVIDYWEEK